MEISLKRVDLSFSSSVLSLSFAYLRTVSSSPSSKCKIDYFFNSNSLTEFANFVFRERKLK